MSFLLNSRRLATSVSFAALTIGLAFSQQLTQKAYAQVPPNLAGSGATSIVPSVPNWFSFSPDISITYNANGSGAGRADFEAGITDFVSTDLTLPAVEGQVPINAVNIPVAIIYNLPGFTLSLSTADVCGILAGTITDFSQLSVPGPSQPITLNYRSDSSGTTAILNIFTTANCGFSVPPFPVGTGVAGSDGIISGVQSTVGAIGYVDTPAATSAGAQIAPVDHPISGPNYVVFRGSYPATKAPHARALCQYITTGGRDYALGLGYTAGTSTSDECSAIQDDAPIPDPGPSTDPAPIPDPGS